MAYHTMGLFQDQLDKIRNGTKRVELRLNDEKRQQIMVGDKIRCISTTREDSIEVLVIKRCEYASFDQLYLDFSPVEMGYGPKEISHPDDMLEVYTQEDIHRWGVLGLIIEIRA